MIFTSLYCILYSGVNMYAMLAGTLPYTVEPFTIKALHKKMINAEMNPLPEHLTEGNIITIC